VNAVLEQGTRHLYFHCQRHGIRSEALHADGRVCYTCAHDISLPKGRFTTWYESAQAFGHVTYVDDDAEKRRVLGLICERLLPGQLAGRPGVVDRYLPAVAIARIDVDRVSAKRNHDD
jgi:nitroimidazol reductase NimA-like FMN-containing flavoprotein (pyridoxamine 5'-phosphate oxidase superfamily)